MSLLYPAGYQFADDNGDALAAGRVTFYATGTTTPQAIYSDEALSVALSNPITLNSDGRAGST